ncbi:hypothetical protein CC78DRAFT_568778 [Lojkania enalia]|uniref:Zn(2)-C6 fungal-type domain-containing protein n=1 Tax=Lojkania enalia TaxID=147567 RepID=A0A9P4N3M1_9PLEO|nr:hypothetical protein CC78DRAFT_568778 [Didymosphaeria enalia]
MPPDSATSSPGVNYWYESNLQTSLEDAIPHEGSIPQMMRRASAAVMHSHAFNSQEPIAWNHNQSPLHLDTSSVSALLLRAQPTSAIANHKAPLAPKQGFGGTANSRAQHQSPITGTYALRTPRGKITSIACESCRKRKSKCDGVRPKCNTCQSKNLCCVYDVAEDGKTTTQLRAHVRRLAKELDDMKSIVSLLAMAPNRATAASWASELEKNGFAHHSADEIKKSLQDAHGHHLPLSKRDSVGTDEGEPYLGTGQGLIASSYNSSPRDESREQSQPALSLSSNRDVNGAIPINSRDMSELSKLVFDCAFYRRTKRELLANGWSESQIFGRNEIDVDTILLGFVDPQDEQSVPTWSSRIVNKFFPTAPMPLRLASTYLLTKMMRWLIWPSVEHTNTMPEWLMPIARPECTPYDILVDLLPWPQLRQHLYQHPTDYAVGAFFGFVHINWPYADDACHYWDIEAGCTRMTPLFENIVGDLNNWTLDSKALEIMPQLDGLVPTKA